MEIDKVKFGAVVGNPPYQEETGGHGRQARPIYQDFFQIADGLSDQFVCLITPSRWFAGGMGLDLFRERMMFSNHVHTIIDFVNAKDCFPDISISGGISYFLLDKTQRTPSEGTKFVSHHHGKTTVKYRPLNEFDTIVRDNAAVSIIRKVRKSDGESSTLDTILSPLMPYGLSTNVRGSNQQTNPSDVKLIHSSGYTWIPRTLIKKGIDTVDTYRVLISKTASEHAGEPDSSGKFRVIPTSMRVIEPGTACTHSYFVGGFFENREPAENLLNYMSTRFVRFLLLQATTSINLSKLTFRFVPIQDFSPESNIDWNSGVNEIDEQLFGIYGLSESEREHIFNSIKPM